MPCLVAFTLVSTAHAQGTMDFSGASSLMNTFKTILEILHNAGGWRHSLYLKIENPPFMALVIEATPEPGPLGLPAISVAHYGEQNGDLMRDPEMCFEVVRPLSGAPVSLDSYYWRNDYVAVEQWSRRIVDGHYIALPALHAQHERFAALWDNNLKLQGFVQAFTDKSICG